MSARTSILAALRGPAPDRSAIDAEAARLVETLEHPPLAAGEPVERFLAALATPSIAATHDRIADAAALPAAVARYLAEQALPPVLTLADPAFAAQDWPGMTIEATPPVDGGVVIAHARAAVAETGTLILDTGPAKPMLANFLALHHIITVAADTIVAHLEDVAQPTPPPRADYWITGVSGTTDIEGQYVRGAHGPRFLHIIVIS